MKRTILEEKNHRANVSRLRKQIEDTSKDFLEEIDNLYDEVRGDENLSQDEREDHLTDLHLMSMAIRQLRRDI